jgi:hypothetical protein
MHDQPKEKSLDKSACQAFLDERRAFLYNPSLNQNTQQLDVIMSRSRLMHHAAFYVSVIYPNQLAMPRGMPMK